MQTVAAAAPSLVMAISVFPARAAKMTFRDPEWDIFPPTGQIPEWSDDSTGRHGFLAEK
jgi:hypothetical protein